MNNILFYGGLTLGIVFLLLSIFLFFFQKIPAVIRYFRNINSKKIFKNNHTYKVSQQKTSKHKKATISVTRQQNNDDQKTELLDIAQNYATALLDADSTEILPDLNDIK